MKDQNNCNHSKTAWKDSKKPVLTGEGLMNYSALRCQKCGAIRKNKSAEDDDMDLIISLSAKH